MIPNKSQRVNEFPPSLMQLLTTAIETAAAQATGRLYAAFDADGTLWDTDVGEAFFDYQIRHCGLRDLPADPWRHYRDLKKVDPRIAYVWLAQINNGNLLEQVRSWANECFARQQPFPVFTSQVELVRLLHKLGVEVFIITASVKWAVEPAAAAIGIDADHVLGVTTRVVDGVVTTDPVYPITWRDGKAEALLQATGGVRPVFCTGNTLGDIALIETATAVQLAVSTQDQKNNLFAEEIKLREEARLRGWKTHQFRPISDESATES